MRNELGNGGDGVCVCQGWSKYSVFFFFVSMVVLLLFTEFDGILVQWRRCRCGRWKKKISE